MEELVATLEQIVNAIPVGKNNAVKVPAFEKMIGIENCGTNNDKTRDKVTEAIVEKEIPIGSNPRYGYWLIDSDAECQEVIDRLTRTIDTYTAKRDAIQAGWNRRKASKAAGTPWPK